MSFQVIEAKDVSVVVTADEVEIAVGCVTALTVTYVNELIGKTDVNAGLYRKKRVRISDFSASIQGLSGLTSTTGSEGRIGSFYFLQEGIRRSELTFKFIFTDQSGVIRTITGQFLIESIEHNGGAEGDFSEFDLELAGTGGLVLSDLESPPEAVCFEAFSDYWNLSEGASTFSGDGVGGKSFAGQEIIEVVRENAVPLKPTDPIDSGTPADGEYSYDGTTITTWNGNPYSLGERAFVIWQEVV